MVEIGEYITKGTKTTLWTAFRKVWSNNNLLGEEIMKLENDLEYNTTRKSLEERIKKIKIFIDGINENYKELEKSKSDFLNRKIIEELNDKGSMYSLFG